MSLASASSKSDGHSASKQDSKSDFWSLLRMLCLDKDGGQSAFSTSSRRSLFLSLTCIVMYSCLSKCLSSLVLFTCWLLLRYLCRLPRRWMLFILIGAWNDTDVDCKRCATKSACCLFPSPSAPVTLRATLSGILSGVDNDHFVTILVKRVTCLLKCYDQCLGVCEKKPMLNTWTAMTLENGIPPREHACLKLHDDPGFSGPATAHSVKTHTSLILTVAPCIFSSLFCCSGFWSNPIIDKRFCVLAMVKHPSANCP